MMVMESSQQLFSSFLITSHPTSSGTVIFWRKWNLFLCQCTFVISMQHFSGTTFFRSFRQNPQCQGYPKDRLLFDGKVVLPRNVYPIRFGKDTLTVPRLMTRRSYDNFVHDRRVSKSLETDVRMTDNDLFECVFLLFSRRSKLIYVGSSYVLRVA